MGYNESVTLDQFLEFYLRLFKSAQQLDMFAAPKETEAAKEPAKPFVKRKTYSEVNQVPTSTDEANHWGKLQDHLEHFSNESYSKPYRELGEEQKHFVHKQSIGDVLNPYGDLSDARNDVIDLRHNGKEFYSPAGLKVNADKVEAAMNLAKLHSQYDPFQKKMEETELFGGKSVGPYRKREEENEVKQRNRFLTRTKENMDQPHTVSELDDYYNQMDGLRRREPYHIQDEHWNSAKRVYNRLRSEVALHERHHESHPSLLANVSMSVADREKPEIYEPGKKYIGIKTQQPGDMGENVMSELGPNPRTMKPHYSAEKFEGNPEIGKHYDAVIEHSPEKEDAVKHLIAHNAEQHHRRYQEQGNHIFSRPIAEPTDDSREEGNQHIWHDTMTARQRNLFDQLRGLYPQLPRGSEVHHPTHEQAEAIRRTGDVERELERRLSYNGLEKVKKEHVARQNKEKAYQAGNRVQDAKELLGKYGLTEGHPVVKYGRSKLTGNQFKMSGKVRVDHNGGLYVESNDYPGKKFPIDGWTTEKGENAHSGILNKIAGEMQRARKSLVDFLGFRKAMAPVEGWTHVPAITVPDFGSTEEAVKFGRSATPEHLDLLMKRRNDTQTKFKQARDAGDFDSAMKHATSMQLDREAIEAHPSFAGKRLPQMVSKAINSLLKAMSSLREDRDVEPTEAQKEAGNYKKGHIRRYGLDITVENPKGSTRKGVDRHGKAWEVKMPVDYGYIRGTDGADDEQVDVFVGDKEDAPNAYIVNQVDPETRKFDEHKVVVGAKDEDEAKRIYHGAFTPGWNGMDSIKQVTIDQLKDWLKTCPKKKVPVKKGGILAQLKDAFDLIWKSAQQGSLFGEEELPRSSKPASKRPTAADFTASILNQRDSDMAHTGETKHFRPGQKDERILLHANTGGQLRWHSKAKIEGEKKRLSLLDEPEHLKHGKNGKLYWEMNRQEFDDATQNDKPELPHEAYVKDALKFGKPVPEHVAGEYAFSQAIG